MGRLDDFKLEKKENRLNDFIFSTPTAVLDPPADPNDVFIRAKETQDLAVDLSIPLDYSKEIADARNGEKVERPGLLMRGIKNIINSFVQVGKNIQKFSTLGEIDTQMEALSEMRRIKEETGREVDSSEIPKIFEKAKAAVGKRIQEQLPSLQVPPAKGIAEKGVDITSGVVAFVAKLAIARRLVGGGGAAAEVAAFEAVNQADAGPDGMGILLATTLGAVGKIPAATPLGRAGKLAGQGGILASITAAEGGSPEDVAVAFLLPTVLSTLRQFPHLVQGKAFEAKIAKEVRTKGFSAKDSKAISRSVRDAVEVQGGRMAPQTWGRKHGKPLSNIRNKYNKAVNDVVKATTPQEAGAKALVEKVNVSPEIASRAIQIAARDGVVKADKFLSAAKTLGIEAAEKTIAEPEKAVKIIEFPKQVEGEAKAAEELKKFEAGEAKVPIKVKPKKAQQPAEKGKQEQIDAAFIAKDVVKIEEIAATLLEGSELREEALHTAFLMRVEAGTTGEKALSPQGKKELLAELQRMTDDFLAAKKAQPPTQAKAEAPKGRAGKLNVEPIQKAFDELVKIVEPGKLVDISFGKAVSAEVIKGTHRADVAMIEFDETKIKGHDKSLGELRDAVGKYSKDIQDKLMLARGTPKDPGALAARDQARADLKREAPELLGILKIMKQVSDTAHDKLVALAGKDKVGYVDDYYFGIYKDPEKVSNFIDFWKTTDKFLKEKKWFTYAEAKTIGKLEIRDPNPITNIQSEYMAIARLQGMTDLRDSLLSTGEDKYISKDATLLAHPTLVQDPVFKGLWVEEDIARMINSLISTNKVSRSKGLNALRLANNLLRELKFIGSAFHQLAIIKHTMADSGYLGFLYKPTAFRFVTKGFGKNDPIFQEEWYKDYIGHGGGHRFSIASEAERAFVRQLSRLTNSEQTAIKIASAPLRLPKNYVEWLFEAYIPKIKALKYRDVVIGKQKKLGRLLTSAEKVDIIKEGQNIYGMMNERIFGRSGTVTTLMRFRFMAPSFAEGNFRQIAKAIGQWGQNESFKAGRSRADIINSFLLTAIAATIGTLWFTGEAPKKPETMKDIRDLFKIDTGKVDERGRRIMIDLMSYDKDFWTIFGKPFTGQLGEVPSDLFKRIGGMTAGTWELMGDLNQISQGKALYDYQGNAVVEITDPFLKRISQLVMFEAQKALPISVNVFQQAREREFDKLTAAVTTLMGTRPTTSEKDRRESQIIRRIFQLKSRQEQLFHYLGTIKNPRDSIKEYNKIVQNTLDNPVMTEKIKKEFSSEDLLIDVDRLMANRVHAHELLKVKEVPEPKNLANSKKWLRNFGITESQHRQHLVVYEMKHRKLIEEMTVSDGDELLKKEIARFYAEKGILDRKVRSKKATDIEIRKSRKFGKIASNISDVATRIFETKDKADRKRFYERIRSVLERTE